MTMATPNVTNDYKLSDEVVARITKVAATYPDKKSALIPALHLVQDEFGWIPRVTLNKLSELLDIPINKIYGVLTFYTMFNEEPVGKYHIQVCKNISCSLLGAKHIIDHLCDTLDIGVGETSDDGKFTISLVECLGSCGTAPVMMINDTYYENLSVEKVNEILDSLE